MKAGMVTQIRVNPRDCQAVLDIMGIIGVDPYDGRSFAQCVSMAFSSMIASLEKSGVLQEPDPYQYLNRMAPFIDSRNNKRKYAGAEALYRNAANGMQAPTLPSVNVKHPGQYVPETITGWTEAGESTTANVPLLMDAGTRELLMERYNELVQIMQGENPALVTVEVIAEFERLQAKLF